jgi:predicted TPR repeat methyltransferase
MDILDLGCGTGLVGVYLGKRSGKLVGADLSSKMLEKAQEHKVYTELRHADLREILQESPDQHYDCIIAADVFIYVGDLTDVIEACHRVLRPGGIFLFSCEQADDAEGPLVLRPSKRFAHSRTSVVSLCQAAGLSNCNTESIDVRMENNAPIPGFIVIAEKT